jgi:polyisoprenoid-binding protein YceI
MKRMFMFLTAVLVAWGVSSEAQAEVYTVDIPHSSINFAVKHMMVARTTGIFSDYQSAIVFDPKDLEHSKFDFIIRVNSIDTRNAARDSHLKGEDFFDEPHFPVITFKTGKVEKVSGTSFAVTGLLTIKGVAKVVVLPVTVNGPVLNPMSNLDAIGIESSFQINRQDYGVKWNKALDNGGLMVGNDVDISVNIEAHQAGKS